MKKQYFSLFELMIMVSGGILLTVLKISLKLPLKIPGHTGIFWMAILILVRVLVNKKGAAALTGLFSACIAILAVPGGKGPLNTFLSYCAAGIGVELGILIMKNMKNVFFICCVGLLGNLAKLLVKIAFDLAIGVPAKVVFVSKSYAFLTYALFGILGGALAYSILVALEKAGMFTYLRERH